MAISEYDTLKLAVELGLKVSVDTAFGIAKKTAATFQRLDPVLSTAHKKLLLETIAESETFYDHLRRYDGNPAATTNLIASYKGNSADFVRTLRNIKANPSATAFPNVDRILNTAPAAAPAPKPANPLTPQELAIKARLEQLKNLAGTTYGDAAIKRILGEANTNPVFDPTNKKKFNPAAAESISRKILFEEFQKTIDGKLPTDAFNDLRGFAAKIPGSTELQSAVNALNGAKPALRDAFMKAAAENPEFLPGVVSPATAGSSAGVAIANLAKLAQKPYGEKAAIDFLNKVATEKTFDPKKGFDDIRYAVGAGLQDAIKPPMTPEDALKEIEEVAKLVPGGKSLTYALQILNTPDFKDLKDGIVKAAQRHPKFISFMIGQFEGAGNGDVETTLKRINSDGLKKTTLSTLDKIANDPNFDLRILEAMLNLDPSNLSYEKLVNGEYGPFVAQFLNLMTGVYKDNEGDIKGFFDKVKGGYTGVFDTLKQGINGSNLSFDLKQKFLSGVSLLEAVLPSMFESLGLILDLGLGIGDMFVYAENNPGPNGGVIVGRPSGAEHRAIVAHHTPKAGEPFEVASQLPPPLTGGIYGDWTTEEGRRIEEDWMARGGIKVTDNRAAGVFSQAVADVKNNPALRDQFKVEDAVNSAEEYAQNLRNNTLETKPA